MKKIFVASLLCASFTFASTAAVNELNAQYSAEIKASNKNFSGFSIERGKQIYYAMQKDKNNQNINCATCHTDNLKNAGKNPSTGKPIEPLAPSVNKARLSDKAEIEKWLTRNFKQVYGRVGTPQEKGDVLAFIESQ